MARWQSMAAFQCLARMLVALRDRLELHLLTADTHGRQGIIDQQLNLQAVRLQPGDEAFQKAAYVRNLGAHGAVAIARAQRCWYAEGSCLGHLCVLAEGVAVETLLALTW